MECWEKIKSFFKRPKAKAEAEEPKPEAKVAEKKAARAPKRKAGSSRGKR